MAWPHKYSVSADGMESLLAPRWHGLTNIFSPSPQLKVPSTPTYLLSDSSDRPPHNSVPLFQPTSFPTVLTAVPHFLFILVGGVGVFTISPLCNSASADISISPTRVTTLSSTESRAVPVVLSLQVYGTVSPAPFPLSPVGFPISSTIEVSLP